MPAGRPKKETKYDAMLVKDLAGVMCTQQEIANILNISLRKFQDDAELMHIYKMGIENAKSSLRRMQWKSAQAGNVTMQIWLGKQYLNQREPQAETIISDDEQDDKMGEYE